MAAWSCRPNTNSTAPSFATSETALAIRARRLGITVGSKYST
jgi:hypothetical protein